MQYVNRLLRSESDDEEAQTADHLNDVSKLLLPFESKVGGIKQNLDHLNMKLDSIPQKITTEHVSQFSSFSAVIKDVENRIHGVSKELTKIQGENRRFANVHNEENPSMVRMRNVRFGNVTQLAKSVTDRAAEIHSFLQTAQKMELTRSTTNLVPDAEEHEIQAFVEGWRNGDKLVDSIQGSDARRTISALRQRRNTIQSNSRTLVLLYDHMHVLSSILATHQELINNIDQNMEERSLSIDGGQYEFERMIGVSSESIRWRRVAVALGSLITLILVTLIIIVMIRNRRHK